MNRAAWLVVAAVFTTAADAHAQPSDSDTEASRPPTLTSGAYLEATGFLGRGIDRAATLYGIRQVLGYQHVWCECRRALRIGVFGEIGDVSLSVPNVSREIPEVVLGADVELDAPVTDAHRLGGHLGIGREMGSEVVGMKLIGGARFRGDTLVLGVDLAYRPAMSSGDMYEASAWSATLTAGVDLRLSSPGRAAATLGIDALAIVGAGVLMFLLAGPTT